MKRDGDDTSRNPLDIGYTINMWKKSAFCNRANPAQIHVLPFPVYRWFLANAADFAFGISAVLQRRLVLQVNSCFCVKAHCKPDNFAFVECDNSGKCRPLNVRFDTVPWLVFHWNSCSKLLVKHATYSTKWTLVFAIFSKESHADLLW